MESYEVELDGKTYTGLTHSVPLKAGPSSLQHFFFDGLFHHTTSADVKVTLL